MGDRKKSETGVKNKSSVVNERVSSGLKSKRDKRDKRGSSDETAINFPPDAFDAYDLPDGEKFEPTGDFEKDFVELCSRVGIPSMTVAPRPHRPSSPQPPPPETAPSKGKDKEDKKKVVEVAPEPPPPVDPENEPPTTYNIVENKFEYLQPRLQVEKAEDEPNKQFIKELYVRGWKVDQRIVDILSVTMPELEKITTIDLWNAGLNDETLASLAITIRSSASLKNLLLDGNDSTLTQKFHLFLGEPSGVQNISLKSCKLSDSCAENLSKALLDNKALLTMNLCFNKITCLGAEHLASALRMNRTLLSLNLGSNLIADKGAKKLAESLSTFALTHEEVVARRQLKSTFSTSESDLTLTGSPSRLDNRSPTAGLNKTQSKDKQKTAGKKPPTDKGGKPADKGVDKSQVKRGQSNMDTSKGGKGKKGSMKNERAKTPVQDVEDVYEFKNPLLEKTTELTGELWIPGNRSLLNLNLSRNQIGEDGMAAFYAAMKYQVEQALEHNRTVSTGLMRLSLQKNVFPIEEPTYILLTELMLSRDPTYKPPDAAPIEELEET